MLSATSKFSAISATGEPPSKFLDNGFGWKTSSFEQWNAAHFTSDHFHRWAIRPVYANAPLQLRDYFRTSANGKPWQTATNSIPSSSFPHTKNMTPGQPTPKLTLIHTPDYREQYANSVQVRVSLWDFFLMFGTINQTAADAVTIANFEGIYLSPPQAKALANLLNQNLKQYEATFGEIRLETAGPGESIQ